MIAERIRILREKKSITQAELAKKLGVTRSGVNAWEMGISIPSTKYVVELSQFFEVSADYILGLSHTSSVSVEGLSDRQIASLIEVIECYKEKNKVSQRN